MTLIIIVICPYSEFRLPPILPTFKTNFMMKVLIVKVI
jgi:hypothetical protein